MQLKCIAIDNEIWPLELIKKYVSKMPSLLLIQTLCDPAVATEFLNNNPVGLLFIDIKMLFSSKELPVSDRYIDPGNVKCLV